MGRYQLKLTTFNLLRSNTNGRAKPKTPEEKTSVTSTDSGLSTLFLSSSSGEFPLPLLGWNSPDLLTTNEPSVGSDVWAFGVVMWEIVTGAKFVPFQGFSKTQLLKHLEMKGCDLLENVSFDEEFKFKLENCWENYQKLDFEQIAAKFKSN